MRRRCTTRNEPELCDVELRLERFDKGPVTEVDLISEGGF